MKERRRIRLIIEREVGVRYDRMAAVDDCSLEFSRKTYYMSGIEFYSTGVLQY
jgi:hypothetical protein